MSNERGIHAALAIELLFERKNDQRLGDVLAQQSDTSPAPCPKLRRDVVDDGNSSPLKLASDAPIEGWRVNHDREIGLAPLGFINQFVKESPNFGEMAQDFGDADDGEIAGIDEGVAACLAHARAAHAEELERGIAPPQGLDELRAIH